MGIFAGDRAIGRSAKNMLNCLKLLGNQDMAIPINPLSKQAIDNTRATHKKRESHPNAKLTQIQVDEMRKLHEVDNVAPAVLIERFNISRSTVSSILRYQTWKPPK